MTRLEKMKDINVMAKFLDKVVQDCEFCPCMEDNICNGGISENCINNFKEYLLREDNEE